MTETHYMGITHLHQNLVDGQAQQGHEQAIAQLQQSPDYVEESLLRRLVAKGATVERVEAPLCQAQACDFRCDREQGHGVLHHHPDPESDGHHYWWMSWPHDGEELLDVSGKPWTGYLLIADVTLPMSRSTDVTIVADQRVTDLWIEMIGRVLGGSGGS